jgi:hypothetical protein
MKLRDLHEATAGRKLFTSVAEITRWLKDDDIDEFKIHDDLTVDVFSNNNLGAQFIRSELQYLPINFNMIDNYVVLSESLISLEGLPSTLPSDLSVYAAHLNCLRHSPREIGRDFIVIRGNKLKDFSGGPRIVKRDFRVLDAQSLESFVGLPEEIHGSLVVLVNTIKKPIPLLDILRVKHLKHIDIMLATQWNKVSIILNKFLKQPYGNKRIIDCQSALIDAGFEDFAAFGDGE